MRYLLIILSLYVPLSVAATGPLTTIGWVESMRILPEGFNLQAKIDTGADNSSLDVFELQNYSLNGAEWVRFKVRNNTGNQQMFERKLERYAEIKRKRASPVIRPVVNMWLCVGTERLLVPVNLAERKDFKYRMLIGRSFLKDHFLVNSAGELTLTPECTL